MVGAVILMLVLWILMEVSFRVLYFTKEIFVCDSKWLFFLSYAQIPMRQALLWVKGNLFMTFVGTHIWLLQVLPLNFIFLNFLFYCICLQWLIISWDYIWLENCLAFQTLLVVCLLALPVTIRFTFGMLVLAWYCFNYGFWFHPSDEMNGSLDSK